MYMALTRKDLQLIKEILQPEFDEIKQKLTDHDNQFIELKEYIDKRLVEQDTTMMNGFKEIIRDVYGDFDIDKKTFINHEIRITKLEARLH